MVSTHQGDEKWILETVLRDLLPHVTPIVNPSRRIISFFWKEGDAENQNAVESFSRNEWIVLVALAEFYPDYSPYEVLLARLTDTTIAYSRQRWLEAQEQGTAKEELHPIRDALRPLRKKLHHLSDRLFIIPVYQAGYRLISTHGKQERLS